MRYLLLIVTIFVTVGCDDKNQDIAPQDLTSNQVALMAITGPTGYVGPTGASGVSLVSVVRCETIFQVHYMEYTVATYSDGSSAVTCLISQNGSDRSNTHIHTSNGSYTTQDQCLITYESNIGMTFDTANFQRSAGISSVVFPGSSTEPAFSYTYGVSECQTE